LEEGGRQPAPRARWEGPGTGSATSVSWPDSSSLSSQS